jgi:DNA-binding transcriptional regulator YiaG
MAQEARPFGRYGNGNDLMNAETKIRKNADARGIEGATMTGAEMRRIRKKHGLSIPELAALMRYRDFDGLRKIESRDGLLSGPMQLVMEMLDDGRLKPETEIG